MKEAVVVASSRTPLAKSFRGSFNMTRPDDLLAHCLSDVLAKVPELDPAEVEDIIAGCATPERASGSNVARVAAVRAGLPVTIAATTVNRFCSSGLQSVAMAAHSIMVNGADAAIGSGVESITFNMGGESSPNPWIQEHKPELYMAMGDTAEVVAKRYGITREAQDEYSLQSQQRTAAGQQAGHFDEELAPMEVTYGIIDKETKKIARTETKTVERDECNRPDTSLQGLSNLQPYFDPDSGKGSVTAGNASQLSDGASATLLMSRERADALGIQAKVAFRGFAIAGCEPDEMGIGPVFAIPKLLDTPRPRGRGHRRLGAQRGVRIPGGLLPRQAGHSTRRSSTSQRRLDLDRASRSA